MGINFDIIKGDENIFIETKMTKVLINNRSIISIGNSYLIQISYSKKRAV